MGLRRPRVKLNLLAALVVLAVGLLPAYPAEAAADYALANGHFFTQTGDRAGTGFAVLDDSRDDGGRTIRFWSEFQRLGGVPVIGYPISRVYRDGDGFYYQLFQRALLQWRPEANAAVFANILDQLSRAGADPALAALGIPGPIADDGSRGDFATAVQTRLGWLTQPQIRAAFLAASPNGDPRQAIQRYGLPTSLPVRSGPFVVQRFQRIALQLWLDAVPGMPAPGSVVPVLGGDLYRQHALAQGHGMTDQRFVGQSPPAGRVTAPPIRGASSFVDDALSQPLDLLAANPAGRDLAAALRSAGVQVSFEEVPAIALFTPSRLNVAVNPSWRGADPKTLAAVLAHEASHLADYLRGADMRSSAGCYRTEYAAFEAQAQVWRGFYGPDGKAQPTTVLDMELNRILMEMTQNPQGFATSIAATYSRECGG